VNWNPLLPASVETFSGQQLAEHARRIAEERPTAEGVKGVRWDKEKRKWVASINYKAKQIKLGYFAALADAIERRLLGEKAVAEGKHPKPSAVGDPLLPTSVETFWGQQLAERARRIAEERPTGEGVNGVCWDKEKQWWRARIWHEGKQIYLGIFAALADAIERRLLAEKAMAEGKHPDAIRGVPNIGEDSRAAARIAAAPAVSLSLPSGQKRERSATGCRAGTRASSLLTAASAPKRARRTTTTQAVLSQAAILLALRAHRAYR
jgi:hypothetical protein